MTDEKSHASMVEELLASAGSRRHFLTGAAAAAASIGLAPGLVSAAALDKAGAAGKMSESPTTILNIAATAEAAAVTALYHVHVAVNQGRLNTAGIAIPVPFLVKIVRGILRQEQDHYAFLTGAGAKPLLTSFTFPAGIFTSAKTALSFLETADEIFTAAYMQANREFATGGMSKLAQYTYQIGATEAAHRSLARAGRGLLPNNRSFERPLFKKVAGAANVLNQLGVLKPNMAYPGAAAVDQILATSGDRDRTAGVVRRSP
jgi:hypothetical protein